MTQDNVPSTNMEVFLPDHERTDEHIVDVLIEERCPSFVEHPTWPVVRPVLHKMLGYDRAVEMADLVQTMSGRESFDYMVRELEMNLILHHPERLPKTGKLIIAANHPTGLADGVAMWEALIRYRTDIQILANADALRVSRDLADVIIPVEWLPEKRSPAKAKETLRRCKAAFEEDACVVIFPSGKLARRERGRLREQDWFPTVVTLARKQNCPVLPVHFNARNSWLFYTLSKLNGQLRDITLFYELLNKKGGRFELTFGNLIQPEDLKGEAQAMTNLLREFTAYELGRDEDAEFASWKAAQAK